MSKKKASNAVDAAPAEADATPVKAESEATTEQERFEAAVQAEADKRLAAQHAEQEMAKLNGYAHKTLITDKAFIQRLYDLNVPSKYLILFTNHHAVLTDKEIWHEIRFCNIDNDPGLALRAQIINEGR